MSDFLPCLNLLLKDLGQPATAPRTVVVSDPALWQATINPYLHWRLLDTDRQVWLSLLWGHKKTSISVSATTLKPLTVQIITNCGKLFKRWEYLTILPVC